MNDAKNALIFARLRTVTHCKPLQNIKRKCCDCFVTRRMVVHERQRVRSTTQRAVHRGMLHRHMQHQKEGNSFARKIWSTPLAMMLTQ